MKLKRFGGKNQELEKLVPKVGEKAPRRWYPILLIVICIKLILYAAVSMRAVPKTIHIIFSQFPAIKNQAIPSYKSVTRWLTQVGLCKLNRIKQQAKDWALIIDHSVQIGTDKLLVILGLRLSKLPKRALTLEDVEVITMKIHKSSGEKSIYEALDNAEKKVGKVAMVCGDDGPDIRKGTALFCKNHKAGRVFDITHKIGVFLKRFLEKDLKWREFTRMAAETKKKMQQTKGAHFAPPNQRAKSRFLNIEVLVSWAVDIVVALQNTKSPDGPLLEEHCGWVREYSELIEQLKQMVLISQKTRHHIREEGISAETGSRIEELLEESMALLNFNKKACEYAGMLIDFCHKQSKMIPAGEVWLGSSEVIESLFGKLKNLERDQSKAGFTALVLGAAACVGKTDIKTVSTALEKVKQVDVNDWIRKQIGQTLLSKKRNLLGKWRRKTNSKKIIQEQARFSLTNAVGF